jgi:hypothetical protein
MTAARWHLPWQTPALQRLFEALSPKNIELTWFGVSNAYGTAIAMVVTR